MRAQAATIAGPMQAWRSLTLSFVGPYRAENAESFRDFKLDVLLREARTGESLRALGYFAADGASADSGAATGSIWRAAFTPPSEGDWTYHASFRAGADIAADPAPEAGQPAGHMDGAAGRLRIAPARAGGPDLRELGPVAQGDDGYVFPRSGASAVERFAEPAPPLLLSAEFDGVDPGGPEADFGAYGGDAARAAWRPGDPLWAEGRGRGVIGALNLMAEDGYSAVWVAPLAGADARRADASALGPSALGSSALGSSALGSSALGSSALGPWAEAGSADPAAALLSFDVSRLAQWEITFAHAQHRGLVLNFDLTWPAGAPAPVLARRLFIREMTARFAHHNGLIWRLDPHGEDAAFLRAIDPYQRPIAPVRRTRAPREAPREESEWRIPKRDIRPAPPPDLPAPRRPAHAAPLDESSLYDDDEPADDAEEFDPPTMAASDASYAPDAFEESGNSDDYADDPDAGANDPDSAGAPRAPSAEPFETRLEVGLRRLQSALLGWRRPEDKAAEPHAEDIPAPRPADAAPKARRAPNWRARLSRLAAITGEPGDGASTGSARRAAKQPAAAVEGGAADIALALFLLESRADGPVMTPVELAVGLDAPRLREGPAALVARFDGADLDRARSARLLVEGGGFDRTEAIDPIAVFEEASVALLVLLESAAGGSLRLRLEVFAENASPTIGATPLRWWSLPLTPTRAAPKPDERRQALAARPRPEAGGPMTLRAVELIDAEADRVVAVLAENGVFERRAPRDRKLTVKATLAGGGLDRVGSLRATLDSDAGRQVDNDRPFGLSDEKVGHFYKLDITRAGDHALTIDAFGAGAETGAALFSRRIRFQVR